MYLYGYFFRRRDDLENLRRKWIMMMMSIKIDIRLRITPDDNKWEFQVASESGGFAEMQRFAKFACDQVWLLARTLLALLRVCVQYVCYRFRGCACSHSAYRRAKRGK